MPKKFYDRKFGPGRWQGFLPRLGQAFAAVGLEFTMGGETGPTHDAHRLLCWADDVGGLQAQDALQEELMFRYFSEGKPPSDHGVLLDAVKAAGSGLDVDAAKEVLDNAEMGAARLEGELARYARGVRGVPHFVFTDEASGRAVQLSGAQPPEVILDALEELGVPTE